MRLRFDVGCTLSCRTQTQGLLLERFKPNTSRLSLGDCFGDPLLLPIQVALDLVSPTLIIRLIRRVCVIIALLAISISLCLLFIVLLLTGSFTGRLCLVRYLLLFLNPGFGRELLLSFCDPSSDLRWRL
jgi:hypothetical protein